MTTLVSPNGSPSGSHSGSDDEREGALVINETHIGQEIIESVQNDRDSESHMENVDMNVSEAVESESVEANRQEVEGNNISGAGIETPIEELQPLHDHGESSSGHDDSEGKSNGFKASYPLSHYLFIHDNPVWPLFLSLLNNKNITCFSSFFRSRKSRLFFGS